MACHYETIPEANLAFPRVHWALGGVGGGMGRGKDRVSRLGIGEGQCLLAWKGPRCPGNVGAPRKPGGPRPGLLPVRAGELAAQDLFPPGDCS